MNNFLQNLNYTVINAAVNINSGGGKIASSTIGKGIKAIVNDVCGFLLILAPIIGVGTLVYFLIRKGMADQQEQPMWQKRAVTTIICTALAEVAVALVNLVMSYMG